MVTKHFDLVSGVFWATRNPKRTQFGPKCPFWRSQRDQIWSQLPPTGLTGLVLWLAHTLAWYQASSGPPGTLKGPMLALSAPFGGPRGPRRVPGDQIWSKLPPTGLTGLVLWLPHTLAWYQDSSGPPGTPKGHFWLLRGSKIMFLRFWVKMGPSGPKNAVFGHILDPLSNHQGPKGAFWAPIPFRGLNFWSQAALVEI